MVRSGWMFAAVTMLGCAAGAPKAPLEAVPMEADPAATATAPAPEGSTGSAFDSAQSERQKGPPPLEIALPMFPSGEVHDLAADRGNVVLLDFWATWCTPCRESLPTYQTFLDRYGAQGLRVYAVSVDEDPNQVKGFVQKFGIKLPILIDQDGVVAEQKLGLAQLPTTFLIDRQGRIRETFVGWDSDSEMHYEEALKALLAEKD